MPAVVHLTLVEVSLAASEGGRSLISVRVNLSRRVRRAAKILDLFTFSMTRDDKDDDDA